MHTVNKKVFCITGALNRGTRDYYKDYIERFDGKFSASVTQKVDYLVTNEPSRPTTKRMRAQEYGIPVISEKELRVMLERTAKANKLRELIAKHKEQK